MRTPHGCPALVAIVAATLAIPAATAFGDPPTIPYRTGWPQNVGQLVDRSSPAVGDLFRDGKLEIVVGTVGKKLWAFHSDGTILPGAWPVTLPGEINSSPAIGDIDGDGYPEIVVGFTWQDMTDQGGIIALRRDGTPLPGWPFSTHDLNPPNGFSDGVFNTPALFDLDGDGRLDVIVPTFDEYLYALRYDATPVAGHWPFFMYDGTWSSAAVGDLDGDGQPEIVVAAYTHAGAPPGVPGTVNAGGIMWVLDRTGAVKPGWPQVFPLHIDSSPALGDIDGDGRLEIVFGTGLESTTPVGNRVYAYHYDGTPVAGWPKNTTAGTGASVWASPTLVDLDGDGLPDVVVGDSAGFLWAWKGNGAAVPGWPVQPVAESNQVGASIVGSAIAVDIDNDGHPEILQPTSWDIVAFRSDGSPFHYGAETQMRLRTLWPIGGTPTVADLDGNGRLQVVSGSMYSDDPISFSNRYGAVFVWDLPVAAVDSGNAPWPMWRQGLRHLGRYAPGFGLFTLAPCRLVDTRGATGPYGAPALAGGTQRSFTITGNCSIPIGAQAVVANITVADATAPGALRIFPGGAGTAPGATSINFVPGKNRANNARLGLTGGVLTVQNDQAASQTTNFILDVSGYFK